MYHRICLRVPLLCLMIFSAIMGRKHDQDNEPIPEFGQKDIHELLLQGEIKHTDIYPHSDSEKLLQEVEPTVLPVKAVSEIVPPDDLFQLHQNKAIEVEYEHDKSTVIPEPTNEMAGAEENQSESVSAPYDVPVEVDQISSPSIQFEIHEHPTTMNPLLEHVHKAKAFKYHKCQEAHDDDLPTHQDQHPHHGSSEPISLRNSILMAIRHLGSSLVSFLPEYIQDTFLHVNDALVFTGIIALTLVSICVPYYFIESFLSVRPLKKKVIDLNKTLWKVSTAFENQQEEYDFYKQKALAYDEDKKQLEQVETELYLVKQIEIKLKTENRLLKKRINKDVKVAEELELLISGTISERDQVTVERDKWKAGLATVQTKLAETLEELETLRAHHAGRQMDLELMTHIKENLELRSTTLQKEIEELKTKLNTEIELRRSLQSRSDSISLEKNSVEEELSDLKSVLHKYEKTVNSLNDEISVKENEFMALKESLGEDSPLIDIAEVSGKLKIAETQASSLQARVESITLENSNMKNDLEKAKSDLVGLQSEKDQASTRLLVLEAYFKEKEDELRRMVEKHENEKEIRGKDKEELVHIIEEKNEAVRDLSQRLEKMKEEFEETKLSHRNEIRTLEAKGHETWLSLCQSERKSQEVRKESEVLRQKLTAIARTKEADGHDALSSNGEVPYILSQLDLDEVPLPLPDEPVSYFGLGDFEPPVPLDDDDDDDPEVFGLQNPRNDQRPPPLGQMSPNYLYRDDDEDENFTPIRGLGGRVDLSDSSSSPSPPEGEGQRGSGAESRENYLNGVSTTVPRRRQPMSTSSPYEHSVNL